MTQLQEKDYLELWKFFSEDAAKVKDRLWSIATWLYSLMTALLAAVFKIDSENEFFRIIILIAGICFSIYTCFMIQQFGMHLRSGWNRTKFLRKKIIGVKEVWDSGNEKSSKNCGLSSFVFGHDDGQDLPPFAQRLLLLALYYGLAFVLLIVLRIT